MLHDVPDPVRPLDPLWTRPLMLIDDLLHTELLDDFQAWFDTRDFMVMDRARTAKNQPWVYEYKHEETRRYLQIDERGQAYRWRSHPRSHFVKISVSEAIFALDLPFVAEMRRPRQPLDAEGPKVKVHVTFNPDHDGTPVAGEYLWAELVGPDLYRLGSIPFHAKFAFGDIVHAWPEHDGILEVSHLAEASEHTNVRVSVTDDPQGVADAFDSIGIHGEGALPCFPLIAFDVPPEADHQAVKSFVLQGERHGRWLHQAGNISPRWLAAS